MAEKDLEASDIKQKVHDLAEAMSRVRSTKADRDDVVVEMKDAKFNRLKLLAEDLTEVIKDIPDDNEQFEFAVTNGETPRLWIDMTSFVRMVADGREYEFVKDTRLGRVILGRSVDRKLVGKSITDYVAERLLERERMIEGDWISAKALFDNEKISPEDRGNDIEKPDAQQAQKTPEPERKSASSALTWLLTGLAIGLIVVLVTVATDQFDPAVEWLRNLTNQSQNLN